MWRRGSSTVGGLFTSQIVKVALPANPLKPEQELAGQRQTDQASQSKVNGRSLGGEAEPSHDLGGEFVIDVNVAARHTPKIYIIYTLARPVASSALATASASGSISPAVRSAMVMRMPGPVRLSPDSATG